MSKFRVKWRTKPEPRKETIRGETVVEAQDDDEAWNIVQEQKHEEHGRTIQVAWVCTEH